MSSKPTSGPVTTPRGAGVRPSTFREKQVIRKLLGSDQPNSVGRMRRSQWARIIARSFC